MRRERVLNSVSLFHSFIKHRMSVRESVLRGVNWRDYRCNISR